ncbi:MAG: hypothetical protein H6Q14_606 [Bacteroidetes bacterium]|jgi:hypothetical protein|nr:hypothetical protein [Bacteroidota bacterium]
MEPGIFKIPGFFVIVQRAVSLEYFFDLSE